jgi:hypothetical protein
VAAYTCLCRMAHVAGSPVELPQATRKDGLLLGIEFVGGVDKPENTGMHQVVQVHMNRQILAHANGDRLHRWPPTAIGLGRAVRVRVGTSTAPFELFPVPRKSDS